MEELPQVPIRLDDAWSTAPLDAFFRLKDESLKQRRQQYYTQNLANLKENIGEDHGSLLP
jgi:hypothetical protein